MSAAIMAHEELPYWDVVDSRQFICRCWNRAVAERILELWNAALPSPRPGETPPPSIRPKGAFR